MSIGAGRLTGIDQEGGRLSLDDQITRIYEESRKDIYRFIVLMGIPREEAQEICQEAFLRLYAAMSGGQQIDNPRAWVFTVARNQALNARLSSAPFAVLDDGAADRLPAASPSPEQSVLDLEKVRRIEKSVALLADLERECLHLRTRGFRYREIASILGVGTSTVGDAMQRAVRRLRKVLYE